VTSTRPPGASGTARTWTADALGKVLSTAASAARRGLGAVGGDSGGQGVARAGVDDAQRVVGAGGGGGAFERSAVSIVIGDFSVTSVGGSTVKTKRRAALPATTLRLRAPRSLHLQALHTTRPPCPPSRSLVNV